MDIAYGLFYLIAAWLAGYVLPELIFIHGTATTGKLTRVSTGVNLVCGFIGLALVTYLLRK